MAQRVQVQMGSPEWLKVDYQIQLATGKSSLKIVNMFRLHSGLLLQNRIDALINITDFSRDYCNRVLNKNIPLQDVIFYCGHLNIHHYSHIPTKIFNVFLCSLHLGTIGSLSHADAFLVQPQDQQQAFQYNYFLKSHSQYEVKYQISFTVSDEKQFKLSELECSNCENRVPTVYCRNQKLSFCEDCSRDHHRSKIMQSHELQKLDKINTIPLCKNHNAKNEYYCLKCQKYICGVCKQKGLHDQNYEHPVKPIAFLNEEKKQNIEFLPKKHSDKIEGLLENLVLKKQQIQSNYEIVKKFVVNEYEQAMAALQGILQEKMTILDSYETELKMHSEKIQWTKAFMKFQEKSLKPIYFFQSAQKRNWLDSDQRTFKAYSLPKQTLLLKDKLSQQPRTLLIELKKCKVIGSNLYTKNPMHCCNSMLQLSHQGKVIQCYCSKTVIQISSKVPNA